jgi:uncharacterized protein YdbL (DUF1318 family)
LLLAGFAMLASAGSAQESASVAQARGAGLIGERFDGYLGFVTTPGEVLRRQVNAINIHRRALYSNLARLRRGAGQAAPRPAYCG